MKKIFVPCFFLFLFFLMLIFSKTTFAGAFNGLNLWLFTVLPSLLPYMIISSFMTESGTFRYLSRLLSPITRHIFALSENCGYVILLGFLCGYPIGSKLSADMVKKGEISVREGQILLAFCNNVSPAFLVTYLADTIIQEPKYRTLLVLPMIFIPLLCGVFFSRFFRKNTSLYIQETSTVLPNQKASLDFCIVNSFETCFKLGGYIILFSILNHYIRDLLPLSSAALAPICSACEITSGLHVYHTTIPQKIRLFTECTTFTAFGGLCCMAQTASMIRGSGLSLFKYFLCKILIASVTYVIFSFLWQML